MVGLGVLGKEGSGRLRIQVCHAYDVCSWCACMGLPWCKPQSSAQCSSSPCVSLVISVIVLYGHCADEAALTTSLYVRPQEVQAAQYVGLTPAFCLRRASNKSRRCQPRWRRSLPRRPMAAAGLPLGCPPRWRSRLYRQACGHRPALVACRICSLHLGPRSTSWCVWGGSQGFISLSLPRPKQLSCVYYLCERG